MSILTFVQQGPYGHFENYRYVARTPPVPDLRLSNTVNRLNQSSSIATNPSSSRAGRIPINAAGHRLDSFLQTPTNEERKKYKSRTKNKHLCSPFYLTGHCLLKNCRYDHSSITPTVLHVLRHKIQEWPCKFEGECRRKDCFHGHVCLVKGCAGHNDRGCNFGLEAHQADKKVAEWVRPVARQYDGVNKKDVKDNGRSKTESSKGSMENWPTMVEDLIVI